jgi:protocatechuate 3,4-dioxygenase beta subunit
MVAFTTVVVAALAGFAAAHPGEKHDVHHMKREILARDNAARLGARSLAACGNSAHAQALKTRSIQRRADTVKSIREKRGIKSGMDPMTMLKPEADLNNVAARKDKRALQDLVAWEATNHNQTGFYDYDMFSSISNVFDANTSCILAPNVTNGPYYVAGEYMRSNTIESEFSEGVNMFLEVQYIDINTCEAIPAVAVDVWSCNATGVYSGVESGQAGLNTTFLRGIQLTDHDGVVQFETIFPGHYSGRAIHTHLLAHTNATVQPNGTISIWFVAPHPRLKESHAHVYIIGSLLSPTLASCFTPTTCVWRLRPWLPTTPTPSQ